MEIPFIKTLWEIIINIVETSLFLYLINNKLHSKNKYTTILGLISITSIISLMNFANVNTNIAPFLGFIIELIFVFLFYKDSSTKKIFIVGTSVLVITISDALTFQIAQMFSNNKLEDLLINGNLRFSMSLVYLTLYATFIYLFVHLSKKQLYLPPFLRIALIILIMWGVFTVQMVLGFIIDLDSGVLTDKLTTKLTFIELSFILIFVSFFLLIQHLGYLYKRNHDLDQIAQLAKLEDQQYQILLSTTETLKTWKHDYQKHLTAITGLCQKGEHTKLLDYLNAINKEIPVTSFLITTGNTILDALISSRLMIAKNENITFNSKICIPSKMNISDIDLCSLVGNILDNALDACLKLPVSEKRYLYFTIQPYKETLTLSLENSCDGKYNMDTHGILQTTKSSIGHGVGLKRIYEIADKYQGFCTLTPKSNSFVITIALPLSDKQL